MASENFEVILGKNRQTIPHTHLKKKKNPINWGQKEDFFPSGYLWKVIKYIPGFAG